MGGIGDFMTPSDTMERITISDSLLLWRGGQYQGDILSSVEIIDTVSVRRCLVTPGPSLKAPRSQLGMGVVGKCI